MATFALKNFGYKGYANLRPAYSKALYDLVLSYHHGPRTAAIDLGCGHGVVTRAASQHFSQVTGIDPSEGMLAQARELTPSSTYPNVTYVQSGAEELSFLPDNGIDAVVSGQAVHWFDQTLLWPELARVLRPGSTVAFWCYEVPKFPDYPAASKITDKYGYGPVLGAYWPGNGASIIRDKLAGIHPPTNQFEGVTRLTREPGEPLNLEDGTESYIVRFELSVADLGRYWRTQSAFFVWQQAHPDRKSREEGGNGDVIDDLLDEVGEACPELKDPARVVKIEFATTMVLARRK